MTSRPASQSSGRPSGSDNKQQATGNRRPQLAAKLGAPDHHQHNWLVGRPDGHLARPMLGGRRPRIKSEAAAASQLSARGRAARCPARECFGMGAWRHALRTRPRQAELACARPRRTNFLLVGPSRVRARERGEAGPRPRAGKRQARRARVAGAERERPQARASPARSLARANIGRVTFNWPAQSRDCGRSRRRLLVAAAAAASASLLMLLDFNVL